MRYLAMTDLVVRRLLVDLEAPIARHWCGGDAFRTALFNALSMSFPIGEQFFIDAVRDGAKGLPDPERERFRSQVTGFIGQEATHRRLHGLFNAHLEARGLVNSWGPRALKRAQRLADADPRHAVAATAAYEHFTAMLALRLLSRPDELPTDDERLRTFWMWHAAEECEHKTVAFDLYRLLGGDDRWRLRWFVRVTILFSIDLARQTTSNLRRDGTLWHAATWANGARFLFGRAGLVRDLWRPWRAYFRRDFHPSQQDDRLSRRWLAENDDRFVAVAGG
jgi:predicted metal-dependent hydrolase